jgi:sulfur carrier protein
MMIQIRLNGQSKSISENLSLALLLAELQVNPQQVAIAKNLEVVMHSELESTTCREGDEIEIFQAVGGG